MPTSPPKSRSLSDNEEQLKEKLILGFKITNRRSNDRLEFKVLSFCLTRWADNEKGRAKTAKMMPLRPPFVTF